MLDASTRSFPLGSYMLGTSISHERAKKKIQLLMAPIARAIEDFEDVAPIAHVRLGDDLFDVLLLCSAGIACVHDPAIRRVRREPLDGNRELAAHRSDDGERTHPPR